MDLAEIDAELDRRAMQAINKPKPRKSPEARLKAMQQGRERKAASERKQKIRNIIWQPKAKACRCGFNDKWTDEQFKAKCNTSCTMPEYLCPTLADIMRTVVE